MSRKTFCGETWDSKVLWLGEESAKAFGRGKQNPQRWQTESNAPQLKNAEDHIFAMLVFVVGSHPSVNVFIVVFGEFETLEGSWFMYTAEHTTLKIVNMYGLKKATEAQQQSLRLWPYEFLRAEDPKRFLAEDPTIEARSKMSRQRHTETQQTGPWRLDQISPAEPQRCFPSMAMMSPIHTTINPRMPWIRSRDTMKALCSTAFFAVKGGIPGYYRNNMITTWDQFEHVGTPNTD